MLTLDENHIYRWDDEVVPGVNEILTDMGVIDTSFMTEEGAARGKRRHLVLEEYDNGKLDWSTVFESDYNYLLGWQEFLKDTGFIIHDIEEQVYNDRWHYAGTLDRAGRTEDSTWIIDIKTGSGVMPSAGLQLALYADACAIGLPMDPPRLGVVHLREAKKKQYAFREIPYTSDALGVVATWQWANKKKDWIKWRE